MKKILIYFTFSIVIGCISISSDFQEDLHDTEELTLTSAGSIERTKRIKRNEVEFEIRIDKSGDTAFWKTADPNFKSLEGYSIGTKWQDISLKYRAQLMKQAGWAYYIKLPSDWNLAFCIGETCTNHSPHDSSEVSFLFKMK